MKINRRLVVVATQVGFTTSTEYTTRNGIDGNGIDWRVLSTTVTEKFPLIIVGRVADREDYRIYIRSL